MSMGLAMATRRAQPPHVALSVAEVERRILRACQTIRALPDRERKFQILPNLWPEIVQDAQDAYGYTDAKMPPFRPSPADVSDCLIALEWARGLERRMWKLIWWRSFGLTFRQFAYRLGRSDEHWRRQYKEALGDVWENACAANNAV